MQDLKVGDLVEVVKNKSHAYKNKRYLYEVGDKAIVTEVCGNNVRIGNNKYGNLLSKKEIKKVESISELTEYEEEIVLRLFELIELKDSYKLDLEDLKSETEEVERCYEKTSKEIKEITKKLLTK